MPKGTSAPAPLPAVAALVTFAILAGCLLLPARLPAQAESAVTATPLAAGDPDALLVRQWLEAKKPAGLPSDLKTLDISDPVEIASPSLSGLFPDWRFFRVTWSEAFTRKGEKLRKKNDIPGENVFQVITLGVQRQSRDLLAFLDSGDYASFGELLARQKIEIRSFDRAQAVWAAFCDLHDKPWQSQPHDWPDTRHWRLGETALSDFHYYFEVVLGEDGAVVSGRLKAEPVR